MHGMVAKVPWEKYSAYHNEAHSSKYLMNLMVRWLNAVGETDDNYAHSSKYLKNLMGRWLTAVGDTDDD